MYLLSDQWYGTSINRQLTALPSVESHLQWRLGFKADYDIPCGELTSAVKIMIVSLANHRYKDIKYLCGGGKLNNSIN